MAVAVLIAGFILTAFVLVLSLVTIKKGYGYKHTIDSLEDRPSFDETSKQTGDDK